MEGEIIPSDTASLAHVERDPHQAAMLIWLQGKAAGIWRSYGTGLGAFLHTTEKHPSEIESLDVARSKEHPKRRELADAILGQRLSTVSSYYAYLSQHGIHDRKHVAAVGRNGIEVNRSA